MTPSTSEALDGGRVRVAGGVAGDYVVVLDPESMDDAYADPAWVGLPVYRPREIEILQRLPPVGVTACANVKRVFAVGWGAVIERIEQGGAAHDAA